MQYQDDIIDKYHMPNTYMNPLEAIRHLSKVDHRFISLIDIHGPPDFHRTRNTFKSLVHTIIYQQLSGKVASVIYKRFINLFPTSHFPTPKKVRQLSLEKLQTAGLSIQKATTIHELSDQYIHGHIRPRRFDYMSADEITHILTKIKGIGPWTASIFLMFALNYPDILPTGDLGIRKGIQKLCNLSHLPEHKTVLQIAEPWRPFRTAASWYLWRHLDAKP